MITTYNFYPLLFILESLINFIDDHDYMDIHLLIHYCPY